MSGDAVLPVLLTAPEPEPGEPQAFPCARVGGRLTVNARGVFELDHHLLLVEYGSSVSVDPPGIHVPGSGFIPTGTEVSAGGGYFSIENPAHRRLATPRTRGVVLAWGLHIATSREPARQPVRRPLP